MYFPWWNEEADLLGEHSSYQAHYQAVSSAIFENEQRYNQVVHDPIFENEQRYNQVVHDPCELLESGPPQHVAIYCTFDRRE